MKKATRQQTKEHNRNLILRLLFENASISRAEISRLTELTRATVSEIVAELLAEGLVAELGPGKSLGGKAPTLLGLVEDLRYFIGLDLARNRFSGAIVNLRGKIISKSTSRRTATRRKRWRWYSRFWIRSSGFPLNLWPELASARPAS